MPFLLQQPVLVFGRMVLRSLRRSTMRTSREVVEATRKFLKVKTFHKSGQMVIFMEWSENNQNK